MVFCISSAFGYADNVAQLGGKSIPYANAVSGSSSVYSMIDSTNKSGTINTSHLLGVSSAVSVERLRVLERLLRQELRLCGHL